MNVYICATLHYNNLVVFGSSCYVIFGLSINSSHLIKKIDRITKYYQQSHRNQTRLLVTCFEKTNKDI